MLEPTVPSEPWLEVTHKYAAKTFLDAPGSNSCEFTRTLDGLQSLRSTLPRPNVTGGNEQDVLEEKSTQELTLIGEELLAQRYPLLTKGLGQEGR